MVIEMADNYDLIVVGAGTAGIPCAVAASKNSARVLLLEKADEIGGSLHISGGHMSAAGARRQIAKGIEDSVENHRNDIARISRGTAREDLVNLATTLAAPALDWLEDNGFVFAEEVPRLVYGHEPYSVARTYYGPDQGKSILVVLKKVLEEALVNNSLELRLNTSVKDLAHNSSGDIYGVILEDATQVCATNIVLATGGFGANAALFERLEKAPLVSAAWPTSTGDGLLMAEKAGAAIAGANTYLPTFGGLPSPDGTGRVRWSDRPLLISAERPPYEIYVDKSGSRWVAEDEISIDKKEHALTQIEKMTFWTVFDSNGLEQSQPMILGWSTDKFKSEANSLPGVFAGETLEELAKNAGIDAIGLVETVTEYNSDLALGKTDNFGRKFRPAPISQGPFYSVQNHAVTLITFSGIDVDSELRVRKSDGEVIPHLFAIGELLGSAATMGQSFAGGMLVMPSISFGKWLGERLTKELSA